MLLEGSNEIPVVIAAIFKSNFLQEISNQQLQLHQINMSCVSTIKGLKKSNVSATENNYCLQRK